MTDIQHLIQELEGGEIPRHVAIIMDGNGRWAQRRGLPRTEGHRQGVEAVRKVVRTAGNLGIDYLTLYTFSSENWSRPKDEIAEIFKLLRFFIRRDLAELHKNNVCLKVIGKRNNVPADILNLLDEATNLTQHNTGQKLIIAFNYGSRDEIEDAVQRIARAVEAGEIKSEDVCADTISNSIYTAGIPDPDILIRTSGEVRLSNFLLWQMAYTEMVFVDTLWPDFTPSEFVEALKTYQQRNRRYGGIVMETGS